MKKYGFKLQQKSHVINFVSSCCDNNLYVLNLIKIKMHLRINQNRKNEIIFEEMDRNCLDLKPIKF